MAGGVGGFVLLLAVVTAARSGPVRADGSGGGTSRHGPPPTVPVQTISTISPPPPTATKPIDIPTWLGTTIALLGAVVFLGLVILLVRRLWPLLRALLVRLRRLLGAGDDRTGAGVGDPDDGIGTELRQRVSAAADALAESTGPPRDAVVACWLDLESAAAATGSPRTAAQTPTEFTVGLLARYAAPARDLSTLLRLYQRARFSDRRVTADDVEVARRCLHRVAAAVPVPEREDA